MNIINIIIILRIKLKIVPISKFFNIPIAKHDVNDLIDNFFICYNYIHN